MFQTDQVGVTRANHFIDGVDVHSGTEPEVTVVAPVNTDGLIVFHGAGDDLVDEAITASVRAFAHWSIAGLDERAANIRAAIARLREHRDEIAAAEALETGRSIAESVAFLDGGLDQMEEYVTEALEVLSPRRVESGISVRLPYGPTALIVPWNYPLAIALRTLPALLMAGNTVVWKPSEKTPLSAVALVRCLGLPHGVVNVILGDGRTGSALVADPRIKYVVHTGSTVSGRSIGEVSGRLLRPALLELGGKDALIVDRDVELQSAAARAARACLENAGQICTSAERILVHKAVHDSFVSLVVAEVSEWSVGRHSGASREVGPLIDERQLAIVEDLVSDAVAQGARVLIGGGRLVDMPGAYYAPTVIVGVLPSMRLFSDELFGPVVAITAVEDLSTAVDLANTSRYGLGATLITESPNAIAQASRVNAAVVWINEWHSPLPGAFFEPYGDSGLGVAGPGESTIKAVSRVMHIWDGVTVG